jgi:NAD(P)-dependent dehydrogenase (short-subunit alcohol dehydrogenase family)
MSSVLVVGGAGGVGAAVVDGLVARGRPVITTVFNESEAAFIRSRYDGRVSAEIVDFFDPEAARAKISALATGCSGMNAVIVCTGIAPVGPVETTPISTYLQTYIVNCVGPLAIYQATLPVLRQNKGRLILISTLAGHVAYSFMSAYVASKFALEGLCDNMRREAEPQGVKISLITPAGGIKTNLIQKQMDSLERDYQALDDENKERYAYLFQGYGRVTSKTIESTAAEPETVAAVVLEALSAAEPESRYLAGDGEIVPLLSSISDRQKDVFFSKMFTEGAAFTSNRVRDFIKAQGTAAGEAAE